MAADPDADRGLLLRSLTFDLCEEPSRRFRDSDRLRRLFDTALQHCINEGLVGAEGFAVDASLIQAEASDRNRVEGAAGLPRVRLAARSMKPVHPISGRSL